MRAVTQREIADCISLDYTTRNDRVRTKQRRIITIFVHRDYYRQSVSISSGTFNPSFSNGSLKFQLVSSSTRSTTLSWKRRGFCTTQANLRDKHREQLNIPNPKIFIGNVGCDRAWRIDSYFPSIKKMLISPCDFNFYVTSLFAFFTFKMFTPSPLQQRTSFKRRLYSVILK